MAPLKSYASQTFSSIQRAVSNYRNINATNVELEILKLLIFTNTDTSIESNITQVDVLQTMKHHFRNYLRLTCIDNFGQQAGVKRYEELLLSLSTIKELSTRVECCMTQQSEVLNTLNIILKCCRESAC